MGSVGSGVATAARFCWKYAIVAPAKGAWWLAKHAALGMWWLMKNAVAGMWHVARWAGRNAWSAAVWTISLPLQLLRWLFIEPQPEFENSRLMVFHFIRLRMGNAEDRALADVLEHDYGPRARQNDYQDDYAYSGRLADNYAGDDSDYDYYEDELYQKAKR